MRVGDRACLWSIIVRRMLSNYKDFSPACIDDQFVVSMDDELQRYRTIYMLLMMR